MVIKVDCNAGGFVCYIIKSTKDDAKVTNNQMNKNEMKSQMHVILPIKFLSVTPSLASFELII